MAKTTAWQGIFPAVTTKFTPDDRLDIAEMERCYALQVDAGVHGLITCGSLGEASTLDPDEKVRDLTDEEVTKLRAYIDSLEVEGDLRRERAQAIKRRAFPWSLAAILTVVGVVGLGAAADPSGANWQHSAALVLPHFLLAAVSLLVVGAAFWVQLMRMHENHALIETILAEVRRIRAARHLPVEEVPA